MKKLTVVLAAASALISAPSLAADLRMPVKAPVVAPAPYFSWSGCYIGAHGGFGFGDKRVLDTATGTALWSFDTDGAVAGGQVGCDWQMGGFVLGVEGSASWANISGSGADIPTGGLLFRTHADADFIATATGRVGWAFGQSLLYVKGGGAWVHDRYRITIIPAPFAGVEIANAEKTHAGWTIGGGFEWAFTPNWSMKLEYNYVDVSRDTINFTFTPAFGGGVVGSADIDQQIHVIKAGINYRFNFGGPATY